MKLVIDITLICSRILLSCWLSASMSEFFAATLEWVRDMCFMNLNMFTAFMGTVMLVLGPCSLDLCVYITHIHNKISLCLL